MCQNTTSIVDADEAHLPQPPKLVDKAPTESSLAVLDQAKLAWLRLSLAQGISKRQIWALVEQYSDPQMVIEYLESKPAGLDQAAAVLPSDKAEHHIDKHAKLGVRIITPADSEYSTDLRRLATPPLALYVLGQGHLPHENSIAIVGSRQATTYGLSQAETLARDLASLGVTITSGLARGIDGRAHEGCLAVNGHTVAITGCGILRCYPREHLHLFRRIQTTGCIISEYPGCTPPARWCFPARNRLIAALSKATLVIQASLKSGALITADHANELGKWVMALPGAIGCAQNEGTLQLLYEGALLVRNASDILDHLGICLAPQALGKMRSQQLSPQEQQIIELIRPEGSSVDSLVERSGLNPGHLAAILAMLELSGLARRQPNSLWGRLT